MSGTASGATDTGAVLPAGCSSGTIATVEVCALNGAIGAASKNRKIEVFTKRENMDSPAQLSPCDGSTTVPCPT
ncbi:MAG TPA: hypothetical protein VEU06_02755 [Micropepsaceae bacterium]|nr:hypothetical protein [Micropepsaceae bacterium]